jgi:hypothetical protein
MDDTAILDSGCTSNCLSATAPCTSKQAAHVPLNVNMPNGTSIQLSHTCDLLLTDLPSQSRKEHILPGMVHNSLLSVGQLCNSRCDVIFNKEQVAVLKDGKCVMLGSRDPQSRLWRFDLKQKPKVMQHECNHTHETSNHKELINYLHAACFSPVKSTWMTAIKNGNFASRPGLTEHAIEKHLSKSTATFKVHMHHQRLYTRSTEIKEKEGCDNDTEIALDNGVKTHCMNMR